MSKYLNGNGIEIFEGDYKACLKNVRSGDVIYFDPPYDYEDAGFNKYVTNIFGREQLVQLKNLSLELLHMGCIVILSNNDTNFVRQEFSEDYFSISEIEAKRLINCKADKRCGVKEVIISGR